MSHAAHHGGTGGKATRPPPRPGSRCWPISFAAVRLDVLRLQSHLTSDDADNEPAKVSRSQAGAGDHMLDLKAGQYTRLKPDRPTRYPISISSPQYSELPGPTIERGADVFGRNCLLEHRRRTHMPAEIVEREVS